MQLESTFIDGLKLIHLNRLEDSRGHFIKVLQSSFLSNHGLETKFIESYFSVSAKNVIRGMHFQTPPAEHTKMVYVSHGTMLDVVLDIRKKSPTYGQYFKIKTDSNHPVLIYIPIGCAHGFLSLGDNTIVTYLQSSEYSPENDSGVKYNSFGMDWNTKNPILSERDLALADFNNYTTPF